MSEPTIPPPSEPPCKGCGQPCHPYYVRRYDGYCLDCANSGIRELESQLTAIRDLLTPLLGTEACPTCDTWRIDTLHDDATGRTDHVPCPDCKDAAGNPTGRRNIADGLSVVECVKRLAKLLTACDVHNRKVFAATAPKEPVASFSGTLRADIPPGTSRE